MVVIEYKNRKRKHGTSLLHSGIMPAKGHIVLKHYGVFKVLSGLNMYLCWYIIVYSWPYHMTIHILCIGILETYIYQVFLINITM